jgi:hypothetical protein
MVLYKASGQFLEWAITDGMLPNQFIDTATVVATLYHGRNMALGVPGTPVPSATEIVLALVADGVYRALLSASFDPHVGVDYILAVDATAPGYEPQHWEDPVVVEVRTP